MIDGLFIAFVVEIGLADVMMSHHQSKLALPVGVDQYLYGRVVTLLRAS